MMHTIGGGASLSGLEFLLRLHKHFPARERFPKELYKLVDRYFLAWYQCTPQELARRSRSFITDRGDYKMREAHEVTMYHSVALLAVPEIRDEISVAYIDEDDFDESEEAPVEAYMAFVYAMHLIGHTTHESPSQKDMGQADKLLRTYVSTFSKISPKFLTYKNHCLIHLAGEARAYGSHLGGFDAYDYENFLGKFRNDDLIRSGREVLTQVYNRLVTRAAFPSPRNPVTGKVLKVVPSLEAEADALMEIGRLDLPHNTVLVEKLKNPSGTLVAKQSITCAGFTVTNRYSQTSGLGKFALCQIEV